MLTDYVNMEQMKNAIVYQKAQANIQDQNYGRSASVKL